MRAVRGVVAPSKRASLAEAASFAAAFAVAGEEGRPDIAAYIRRFRSALDELVRLHREIDPHGGGEVESPSGGVKGEVGDVGARVLGSEETRGMRKKKKRKREEVDGERSGFDGGVGVGDLGEVRRKKKKKKEKKR
ncbi:uncharacterized protein LOC109704660 [Ananas comosus]|uniref:Uncharacterized protein LOC109704660 n=1 Tax=Ananas comosus TaxID=4615 RepID=A0A6P5ECB4_ANACO|nr:uncharacterized protein LOC109704660 [Ananas comosus]